MESFLQQKSPPGGAERAVGIEAQASLLAAQLELARELLTTDESSSGAGPDAESGLVA